MAAFPPTNATGYYVIYTRDPYYGSSTSTSISTNNGVRDRHMSRRERELAKLLHEFKDETKKLENRLRAEEKMRKAMSDSKSRMKRPHPSVKKDPHRRMQTYSAAVAMRQLQR